MGHPLLDAVRPVADAIGVGGFTVYNDFSRPEPTG
jgi:hypothetical protein